MVQYSIGELADVAQLSVRTLRHYDEIGLLRPSGRTGAGHRRYDDNDADRLQQIVSYRELGFALPDIAAVLDEKNLDPLDHLRRQAHLTRERIHRLQHMLRSIEKEMEANAMGSELSPEDRQQVFAGFDQYQDEARDRWADTEQYAESQRRRAASTLTAEEIVDRKAEGDAVKQALARLMVDGVPSDSEEAMDLAEQMRRAIDRDHYSCGHEFHRGLANMYLADSRFTEYYERVAEGLARYIHDAIHANADRAAS